jgi:hypothetical protein
VRAATRRVAPFVALAGAVVALLGVATTVPAGAHGDTGQAIIEVEAGTDPARVRVRARLVYSNDFEPAPGAAVTADAVGADGSVGASAPLSYVADGVYAGELALPAPGAWTVRVTAADPAATAEAGYTAPPPTTAPPTSAPPTTGDAPSEGTRLTGEQARSAPDGDDDTPIGVVLAVGAAFVFLCGVWFVLHRRRSGNTSPG